jgi:hypothetical protein
MKTAISGPLNRGTIFDTLTGINGVGAGGTMQAQITPSKRLHRIQLFCQASAAYTSGTTLTIFGQGGTAIKLGLTIVAGVITAVTQTTAGTGMTANTYSTILANSTVANTTGLILSDPATAALTALGYAANQYGQQITITVTATALTVASTVITAPTGGAVPPAVFFASPAGAPFIISVGGSPVRDIPASYILGLNADRGDDPTPGPGYLTLYFTQPRREVVQRPEITCWDLWGQSMFQIQATITPNITGPTVQGLYEYDADTALRNYVRRGTGTNVTQVPILEPVGHKIFSTGQLGAGQNSITKIPISNSADPTGSLGYLGLWFLSNTLGAANILSIMMTVDSAKFGPFTPAQLLELYAPYRFTFNFFHAAVIFDFLKRIDRRLRVVNSLDLYITLNAADSVTILRETTPKGYISV